MSAGGALQIMSMQSDEAMSEGLASSESSRRGVRCESKFEIRKVRRLNSNWSWRREEPHKPFRLSNLPGQVDGLLLVLVNYMVAVVRISGSIGEIFVYNLIVKVL